MAGTEEHPDVMRMVVLFLRFTAGLSQTELGRAAGMTQGQVSRLECGPGQAPEEAIRRIAAAAGVPWPLVVRLRRFLDFYLSALSREAGIFREADPRLQSLSAVSSYLLEDLVAASQRSPSDLRLEAARFWAHVEGLPPHRRRRAVELSPRASRSWALAERLCHESERAASSTAAEALDLADLALRVAQRVEGGEDWRCQIQGYAWAYVGNARRAAKDLAGADAAFVTAWELWRDSSAPEAGVLAEWRMLSLEASLRRDQRRFPEALELLARAQQMGGDAPEIQGQELSSPGRRSNDSAV
jgi:transcriptional regulator with XRE-family HTH domain